jgi:hypothetical protein
MGVEFLKLSPVGSAGSLIFISVRVWHGGPFFLIQIFGFLKTHFGSAAFSLKDPKMSAAFRARRTISRD